MTATATSAESPPGRAIDWIDNLSGEDQAILRRLGINFFYKKRSELAVQVGSQVGFVEIRADDSESLRLQVVPKVDGSVSNMLRAVLQLDRSLELDLSEQSPRYDNRPSAWLSAIYIRELHRFLSALRARGEEVRRPLTNHIRGRLEVDEYLKRNYFTSRNVVPCRFIEWTPDNLPNRVLLSVARQARMALAHYGDRASGELGLARRCEASLFGVSETPIRSGDIVRCAAMLRGSFRHYRRIVYFASLIIGAVDPFDFSPRLEEMLPLARAFSHGSSPDGRLHWDLVSMPVLFEEYVRAITGGGRLERRAYRLRRSGTWPDQFDRIADKNLTLDRAPITIGGGLVLDAKYKVIGEAATRPPVRVGPGQYALPEYSAVALGSLKMYDDEGGDDGQQGRIGAVSSADLYQAVAYASHEHIRAGSAALVYPSLHAQDTSALGRYEGLGFRRSSANGVAVYVLGARIDAAGVDEELAGRGLRRNVEAIGRGA